MNISLIKNYFSNYRGWLSRYWWWSWWLRCCHQGRSTWHEGTPII